MSTSRNTIQRELVLQAVQQLRHHPTADDVYHLIAQDHSSISRATVYRNLSLLAQRGQIRRVSHIGTADRFDFATRPHYHFRCEKCGGVFDVALPPQADLLAKVDNTDGFVLSGFDIRFFGTCPACAGHKKAKKKPDDR